MIQIITTFTHKLLPSSSFFFFSLPRTLQVRPPTRSTPPRPLLPSPDEASLSLLFSSLLFSPCPSYYRLIRQVSTNRVERAQTAHLLFSVISCFSSLLSTREQSAVFFLSDYYSLIINLVVNMFDFVCVWCEWFRSVRCCLCGRSRRSRLRSTKSPSNEPTIQNLLIR